MLKKALYPQVLLQFEISFYSLFVEVFVTSLKNEVTLNIINIFDKAVLSTMKRNNV